MRQVLIRRRDGVDIEFADGRHPADDAVEQYSMGRLSGPELTEFEEHVLVCQTCQSRVVREDAFRQGIRDAAPLLETATPARRRSPVLVWGTGLAAALLLIFGTIEAPNLRRARLAPAVILLQTTRGGEQDLPSAPARRPLTLVLDITGLAVSPAYSVEVVDQTGRSEFTSNEPPLNNQLRAKCRGGLRLGTYFVRVYTPARELLREYALTVK